MSASSKSFATFETEIDAAWRDAWRLPDRVLPSQWAERSRYLTAGESAEPGLWRNDRTPYLAGIMDAVAESGVEEISFVKPTQVGGSESLRNVLGYWVEEDPGPCLIVMPSESAVRELLDERLKPLILNSPDLRRHWSGDPHDMTHSGIRLDTMPIYFGWAGSPQSLASRPCRYVVLDEVDKYPPFAGREADPISLAIERTATYGHRRKILKISTPTTRNGAIFRAWENSGDRRHFRVPCPHCGEFQELAWQRVKWMKLDIADAVKRADAIEQGKLAWYECEHCGKRIDDHHKPKMLQGGRWVRDAGCDLSKRVAFHLDAVYSPWRTFASEAAEDIRAGADPGARMNVTNSRRAQPFDNLVSKTQAGTIRKKSDASEHPRGFVPKWATHVFATADTQKDWFKLHIGAWGPGFRYRLVQEMECQSFDEVYRHALETAYPIVDSGLSVTPMYLLIDSGGTKTDDTASRTAEVYEFAARNPGQIIPTKGYRELDRPWSRMETGKPGLNGRKLNTTFFKDMLNRLVHDADETKWSPHKDVSEQYCIEMASEHKIVLRGRGEAWEKKTSGARNESWDCEVLQCFAAYVMNLGAIAPPVEQQQQQPAPRRESSDSGWGDGWSGDVGSWSLP